MTKIANDSLLVRWQTFRRLQALLPLVSSQITIASTLQLRLPVSSDVLSNIKPKASDGVLQQVSTKKLKAEDLVLFSNKTAAGSQVVDFLKNHPENVSVTTSLDTSIVRFVPAKGKRADVYVDDGTFSSRGFQAIPGDEFAKLLGIVSTSSSSTVAKKTVVFATHYTIDI